MKKNQNKDKKDYIKVLVMQVLDIFKLKFRDEVVDLLVQIFKFVIVGCVSTCIDFIFLYIFRDICNFPLILSNTLSFCISVIYNYWASMKFVFNVDAEKNNNKTFVIFIIFSVIGLLLNNFIVYIATDKLGVYYMLSKVIATIFVMIFNFVTRKKFLE